MYRRVARFFLDAEHDFVLERSAMKYSRLRLVKLLDESTEHDFVLERSAMKYSRLKVSKAFRWENRISIVCTGT